MRIQTINSKFQPIHFLSDLAEAERVDVWLSNIIKGSCQFRPLNLTLVYGGIKTKLIEHGVYADDATLFTKNLVDNNDYRFRLPDDKIDIYIDLEKKSVTVNIT